MPYYFPLLPFRRQRWSQGVGTIAASQGRHASSITWLCNQSKTDQGKTKYRQESRIKQLQKAQGRSTISNCKWEPLKPQTSAQAVPAEKPEAPLPLQARMLQKKDSKHLSSHSKNKPTVNLLLSVSKAAASHQGWNFHLGLAGTGL